MRIDGMELTMNIHLKLGKYDCMLVVYGSTYSNGLVWGESIPIRIVKNPETT